MSKKILFVIANNGFQDSEYSEPRKILEDNGFLIEVASNKKGECIGMFGKKVISDYTLEEVNTDNYEMVVMVGGTGAWDVFHKNEKYLEIAKKAKILGAICIGPTLVSDSGVYDGIKVTGWDKNREQENYIKNNSGIFLHQNVVVDGKFITANGPASAKEFGKELLKALN